MDMKKILQAMDGITTRPVEGADSMAKFLRVVKEAEINQPAFKSAEDNFATITQAPDGTFTITYHDPDITLTGTPRENEIPAPHTGIPTYQQAYNFRKQDFDLATQFYTMPPAIKVDPSYGSGHQVDGPEGQLGSNFSNPTVVHENTAQVTVPEIPPLPAQDGDQGNGEVVKTNADGTRTYSGGFGTFTYDAQGKAIKYSTPNFNGLGQTVDLTNQQTTQNYNSGPMSVSRTTNATGKQVAADTTYDLGVAKLRQQTNATGQNTNTAYVPDGDATHVVQENSLSKFLSIVDKNNVSILSEGNNPHKVTLPVQMAMQHYQQAKQTPQPRERLIDKYFVEAETEIIQRREEKRALINQYAKTIAERVLMKESAQGIAEAPIAMDPAEPNNPTIHNHQKANAMTLKGRIASARAQLQELAQLAESNELVVWEKITRLSKGGMFMGLEQNLEQIRHGISELATQRRKGGTSSRGIDKHIGEGKRK